MKNDRSRDTANRTVIRDIAEDIVSIGEYFTKKHKEVIWVGAPLRKSKTATGFFWRLRKEVQPLYPRGLFSIATGQKMVDDLEGNGNWVDGTAKWFERDEVHLKKEAIRHIVVYHQ